MDSRQLLQFRIIAQEENLQRASEILYITPSALSKTIINLENELRCQLFTRHNKRIILNKQGKILLNYANIIYDTIDAAKKEINHSFESNFRIVSVAPPFVNFIVDPTNRVLPDGFNYITAWYNENMLEMLLKKDVAAILDFDRSIYSETEIRKTYIADIRFCVIVHENHQWAKKTILELNEIEGCTFLCEQNAEYWNRDFMQNYNIKFNLSTMYRTTFLQMLENTTMPVLTFAMGNMQSNHHLLIPLKCKPRPLYLYYLSEDHYKISSLLGIQKKI